MTRRGSKRKKSNNAVVPVSGHGSTQYDSIDRAHEVSNRGYRPNFGRHPDHADSYRVTHIGTDESTESFKLFDKAKSMISKLYPGKKIITFFEDINLEIVHLIPLFDRFASEMVGIKSLEENSILLGSVEWFSLSKRVIFVKDVNGGVIHFKLDQTTPLSELNVGRFIAIISPKVTLLPDGKVGFRTEENVHLIDRRSLESFTDFGVWFVIFVCFVLFVIFTKS